MAQSPLQNITKAKNVNYAISTDINELYSTKELIYNKLSLNPSEATENIRLQTNTIDVAPDDANAYTSVYNTVSNTDLYGTNAVNQAIGQWSSLDIGNQQSVTGFAAGLQTEAITKTTANIGSLLGLWSKNVFASAGGKVDTSTVLRFTSTHNAGDNTLIDKYNGIYNTLNVNSENTGTAALVSAMNSELYLKGKTKYTNAYGYNSNITLYENAVSPTHIYGIKTDIVLKQGTASTSESIYGLYVNNIQGAKNNYAIYTGKEGKVRIGDLEDLNTPSDRQVVVGLRGL